MTARAMTRMQYSALVALAAVATLVAFLVGCAIGAGIGQILDDLSDPPVRLTSPRQPIESADPLGEIPPPPPPDWGSYEL